MELDEMGKGAPMGIFSSFTSLLLDIAQPSLFESTITGLLLSDGLKTRSQLIKKLFPSDNSETGWKRVGGKSRGAGTVHVKNLPQVK
jgi:hypothetical protein